MTDLPAFEELDGMMYLTGSGSLSLHSCSVLSSESITLKEMASSGSIEII